MTIKKRNIQKTTNRIQFYDSCPHCEKEIIGYSMGHVEGNLVIHIMSKHKEILKNQGDRK